MSALSAVFVEQPLGLKVQPGAGGTATIGGKTLYALRRIGRNDFPAGWLAGAGARLALHGVFVFSDGAIAIGLVRLTALARLKAAALATVRCAITMDDGTEHVFEGLASQADAPAEYQGLAGGFLGVNVIATFEGTPGKALYDAIAARPDRADGIPAATARLSVEAWDPAVFGHWYATFTAGGGRIKEFFNSMSPQATKTGDVVTQAAAASNLPAQWARAPGIIPAVNGLSVDVSDGLCSLSMAGPGEIIQAVINNMTLRVEVFDFATHTRQSVADVPGPNDQDLPTKPYVWVPEGAARADLIRAMGVFAAGTHYLNFTLRPGPVWRWWSGEGTREFHGETFTGALQRGGASMMEITPVEITEERPSLRARVRLGMTSAYWRRELAKQLGEIGADVTWIGSEDGGQTWQDVGLRIVGRISLPEHTDGVASADIESWGSDGHMKVKKWSPEHVAQTHPGNKFFEYMPELEDKRFDWPRIQ